MQYTRSVDFEVIVVDNASTDGSVETLKARFPDVALITNDLNLGFATACNQGMRRARGELILLLNSDTYVRDDVIGKMAQYVVSRPEITMAGCQLRYPDGRVQHTANRSLSIWRSLFEDLWLYKLVPKSTRDRVLLGGYWNNDEEVEVDWLAGAFMMLRREAFEEAGGFAEEFFMYGEDCEWCMRLRRAGYRIVFCPVGIVYHIGSVSVDLVLTDKERLRLCHLGGLRAYRRVHGRALGLIFHLVRVLGVSVRCAVYSILGAISPVEYYRYQRRVYGWQVGFYLRAFVGQAKAADAAIGNHGEGSQA